jgi:hypothetical protein
MNVHYLFHFAAIARHSTDMSDRSQKKIRLAAFGGQGLKKCE